MPGIAGTLEFGDEDRDWLVAGPLRQAAWLEAGRFALRAAAVTVCGRAIALCGPAASGKSAVAAALALRGHRMLADGALPVDPGPVARGAADGLELWPAAVEELGLDPARGEVVRPALAKRAFRFEAAREAPLGAVVLLQRGSHEGAPVAERVRGHASARRLAHCTAMTPAVESLGLQAEHFRWVTGVAAAVPVFQLRCDRYRRDLAAVADVVEGLMR
jgi:hypothetical protein